MTFRVLLALTLPTFGVWAQSHPAPPSFEVASVRLRPDSEGYTSFSPFGGNRYTATNATLEFLVQLAYGVPSQQISGTEKLGLRRYDVNAKAEDGVILTLDQLQAISSAVARTTL